jgi:hypothetical protein
MDSEEKIIIAFVFNRSGRIELSYSEFYLTLSMELNWFTPEEAKIFVDKAVKNKYLTKKTDQIKPAFEINKIMIPLGFSPSKRVFFEKQEPPERDEDENLLDEIVNRISEKTKLNKQQLYEKIEKDANDKNIIKEVSALIIGKKYDINFDDLFEKIEEKI